MLALTQKSRLGAIALISKYSMARIYPSYYEEKKKRWIPSVKWSQNTHLTKEQIKTYPENVVFAVRLDSVPFCVLDFDFKCEKHKDGMLKKDFAKYVKLLKLKENPCKYKSPSGGWHFFYKNEGFGRNYDVCKGIEMKTGASTCLPLYGNPLKGKAPKLPSWVVKKVDENETATQKPLVYRDGKVHDKLLWEFRLLGRTGASKAQYMKEWKKYLKGTPKRTPEKEKENREKAMDSYMFGLKERQQILKDAQNSVNIEEVKEQAKTLEEQEAFNRIDVAKKLNDVKEFGFIFKRLGWKVRFNQRTLRPQILGLQGCKRWEDLDKRSIAEIYEILKVAVKGKLTDKAFIKTFDAYLNRHKEDPVIKYFEKLIWDGKERLDRLFSLLFVFDEKYDELAKWFVAGNLICAVARTYKPYGHKHDEIPVIAGPQGICKSTFVCGLSPKDEWLHPDFTFKANKKEWKYSFGKLIIEAPDVEGLDYKQRADMKAFITAKKQVGRNLYIDWDKDFIKRFTLFITTNEIECLPDDKELRRFAVITIKKCKYNYHQVKAFLKKEIDQIWAEAVHRYKEGEETGLPEDLREFVAFINKDHRNKDEYTHEGVKKVITHLEEKQDKNKKSNKNYVLQLSEVCTILKDGILGEASEENPLKGWVDKVDKRVQRIVREELENKGYKKGSVKLNKEYSKKINKKSIKAWYRPLNQSNKPN